MYSCVWIVRYLSSSASVWSSHDVIEAKDHMGRYTTFRPLCLHQVCAKCVACIQTFYSHRYVDKHLTDVYSLRRYMHMYTVSEDLMA